MIPEVVHCTFLSLLQTLTILRPLLRLTITFLEKVDWKELLHSTYNIYRLAPQQFSSLLASEGQKL